MVESDYHETPGQGMNKSGCDGTLFILPRRLLHIESPNRFAD